MKTLRVNMTQFRSRWRYYSDNVRFAEMIQLNRGTFATLDARGYQHWLDQFNIFYTLG